MKSEIQKNVIPADWRPGQQLLANQHILITGAGDGIGRTLAKHCAQQGATVILLGRTQEKLESLYDEIMAENLPEPFLFPMDLLSATQDDYQRLATAVEEELGHLDALVLNAALLGQRAPISSFKTDIWDKVMQVNVNAQFYLIKALLPSLEKSQQGRILLTSSSVGRTGRAYWGVYSVSKFAVEGLMQVLADELENTSSIRVNSINPGATRTGMRAQAYPAEDPGQLKTAESLMPLYLFMLSGDSQHIHGQMIDAN